MYYSLINPVDSTYHIQLSTVNNKIIMIIGNTSIPKKLFIKVK